jgi:hypothetical protein
MRNDGRRSGTGRFIPTRPASVSRLAIVGLVGILTLIVLVSGCGGMSIPSGAQVVHVAVTASEIHVDPATVRAGDVYLVVAEGPVQEFQLVSGPFTDAGLARFVQGDPQGTRSQSIGGPVGNVFKVALQEGKYALVTAGTGGPGVPIPPGSMAVLSVLP